MEDLPAGLAHGIEPDRTEGSQQSSNGPLERRTAGELTPAERVMRRRNRRRAAAVVIPALILGSLALAASILAGSGPSGPQPLDVPSGYQAVTDGVFGYSVPGSWQQAAAYTDDVGDLATEGQGGWVGEHLGVRSTPPVPGETPPASFAAFGQPRPTPFHLSDATPTHVAGTTDAYRYLMTRPGGFRATAIDAWQSGTEVELWFLVDANTPTSAAILASLRG